MATLPSAPNQLSGRAVRALKPGLPYFKAFAEAMKRPWSVDDPEGVISIVVAENKLGAPLVHERLLQCRPPPNDVLFYTKDMNGYQRLRKAISGLMSRTFMKGLEVDPDHLTVLAGAGAILDNLMWCIGAPGEGVLIPRPYYPAFDNDLQIRCGMEPIPFDLCGAQGESVSHQLDKAAADAASRGSPVKVLLLTNPNNPLSTIYTRDTLLEALRWCLANRVHVVSDEIYAMSVWGEDAPHFESMESIARAEAQLMPDGEALIQDLVHVVFGLSKDFCASGLRFGCLHSRNPSLNKAVFNLSYFCMCSGHTQSLLTELLEDTEWVDSFLQESSKRLRQAFQLLSGALKEANIPFVQAYSAMFCWVDMRGALLARRKGRNLPDWDTVKSTWEEEQELWSDLVYKHKVLVTPGEACHAAEPGFFRLCWACVPDKALPEAVMRMSAAFHP
ncbi:hypothetical protein CEUSTIGMA_g4791.t1 [Chlamydomonas eustigma]|uniref:Aminotransferase class I/classII large domain-containing protein n=1 Tax=Chlamydomonas eustigma TaxID=1157962 RepID=A0A250X2R4_9CHLO|nr:hypothetical protein CEUSTIGMA_g4791.t1 [Chlamydomonas eustigma]|eukprot:GAX77345.1 hypothetical protein CEUSTIGMA_g4791.t1 [Chlamydomonas eustigma]